MRNKTGLNFIITIITLLVFFGFIGYLFGHYVVATLTTQYRSSLESEAEPSAPVFTSPPARPAAGQEMGERAAAPSAPEDILYRVQVGVFSEKANADRMVLMLKEADYEALVIEEPSFYRVQTGSFSSAKEAAQLVEELKSKGFEAIVVR